MSESVLTEDERTVEEETTVQYTATIKDEDDAAISLSSLTSLTLTIYDKATSQIVNSRNAADVKNANGGAVSAGGELVMTFTPDDMQLINDDRPEGDEEVHCCLFRYTWDSGNKKGTHRLYLRVIANPKVT
jgi:hypothetical protein